MSPNNDVCLVIPVYNEQDCISQVVEEWTYILQSQKINFSILIINDGSLDNTANILENIKEKNKHLKTIHQENSGHGASIHAGYKHALNSGAKWVFQVDSDNQFSPRDFQHLWELKDQNSVIQGVRKNRHDPLHRKIISKCLKLLTAVVYGLSIRDANCPFRLYPANVLQEFIETIPKTTFAPNIFLSLLAAKTKTLREISVQHIERQTGQVSIIRWNLVKACVTSFRQFVSFRKSLQHFQLSKPKYHEKVQRKAA